jgi:tetratricopeptide (TPR) repeat protein
LCQAVTASAQDQLPAGAGGNEQQPVVGMLEEKVLDLQESLAACGRERDTLKAKTAAVRKAETRAEGLALEAQSLKAEHDSFKNELALASRKEGLAQAEIKALQGKLTKLEQERQALEADNLKLRRRLNLVRDGFDREKSSIYRDVGASYADAHMLREAILAYDKALVLDPKDHKSHYALGMLFAALGNDEGSVRHLNEYLSLLPYASNTKEVEYLINTIKARNKWE